MDQKKYDVIITNHSRQRWLERIVDPKRYYHLRVCKGCDLCTTLLHNIHNIIKNEGRSIDRDIVNSYRYARDSGTKITDISFMQAIAKNYGSDAENLDFIANNKAIFVLFKAEIPRLLTVLSHDMIDGFVIMKMDSNQSKQIFNRWKYQQRQKK